MELWLTLKDHFYTEEKVFELFCIEYDFAKYLFCKMSEFIDLNILFRALR